MNLITRGMCAHILGILLISVSISNAEYAANVLNFGSLEIFSYEDDNSIAVTNIDDEEVWSGVLTKGDMCQVDCGINQYTTFSIVATGLFTVLNGDATGNTISGYYAIDPEDKGVSTELYTSFPESSPGSFIVFAYEDDTTVDVCEYSKYIDPNSSDPNDFVIDYFPISSTITLNAGEHIAWNNGTVSGDQLRVTANKGVSALCATDSGYFVPAANGTFSGQQFYTYFSSAGGDDTFVFVGYTDNTNVTVTQEGSDFINFTLDRGEVYELDMNEENGRTNRYYEVSSSNNISVAVYNSNNRLVFAPGEDGSGFGSLDNYIVFNMLNSDDNLHVISHCDNTTITLYNVENGLESNGNTGSFPVTLDAGEAESGNGGANIGCENDYKYTMEADSDDLISVYYGRIGECYAEFVPLGFNIIKQPGFAYSLVSVYNGDSEIDLTDNTFPDDNADIVAGDVIDIILNGTYSGTDTNCTAKIYLAPEMNIDFNTALDSNYDYDTNSYSWSLGDMPFTINDGLSLTINEMAKAGTSIKFHVKYESDQHRKVYHYSLQVGKWTSDIAVDGVVYVNQNSTGYNSGTSWDNSFTDLNQAFMFINESAYDYDTIWVAKGAYAPMSYCNLKEDTFNLNKGIKIYGGFSGSETSLDERDIADNKTILTGNVYNIYDTETYSNTIVTIKGTNTILNGFLVKSSSEEAIKVSVTENEGAEPEISKCAIVDSAAYGIFVNNSSADIINCNICGNTDYGIYAYGTGNISVLNSFIHANGGGISIDNSSTSDVVRGNTIAYNAQSGIDTNSAIQISNNIIWANNEQITSPSIPEYCCVQGWIDPNSYNYSETITDPNNNLQCDPLFAYPLFVEDPNINDGFYDLHLSSDSPCINKGKTDEVDQDSETDIDGLDRVVDSYVDMGADEVSCDDTNSIYDTDKNGIVNLKEFAGMAATWLLNNSTGWDETYNFDSAGTSATEIDVADFTILSENWLWKPCYVTSNTISELASVKAFEVPEEIYDLMLEYGIANPLTESVTSTSSISTLSLSALSSTSAKTSILSLAAINDESDKSTDINTDNTLSVVSVSSMLIDDDLSDSDKSGILLTTKTGKSILDLKNDQNDPKVSDHAFIRDLSREALLARKKQADSNTIMTPEMQAIMLNELYDFIVEIKDSLSPEEYSELIQSIDDAKDELKKNYKIKK